MGTSFELVTYFCMYKYLSCQVHGSVKTTKLIKLQLRCRRPTINGNESIKSNDAAVGLHLNYWMLLSAAITKPAIKHSTKVSAGPNLHTEPL